MNYVAGIDVGSRYTKVVILDGNHRRQGVALVKTSPDFARVAKEALDEALTSAGLTQTDLCYVASTGFGRRNVPFRDIQVTEITCAARGAVCLFPQTRSILDVGFQSTRAIQVQASGKVQAFRTNDKCAAGAGGFLERAARYLEIGLEDLGSLSARAERPQTISSVCAVLGETEIINHMSDGQAVENILAGIHLSLATRAQALLKLVGLVPEFTLVSGLAKQNGMVKALELTLGLPVNVPDEPEFVCALGAALLAWQRVEKTGTY